MMRVRRKKQKETKAIYRLPDCLPSIAAKTALSSPGNFSKYFPIFSGIFPRKILYIRGFLEKESVARVYNPISTDC
jgi:hypothetical protein